MENLLFLDTETTGFKKGGELIQDGQGRVCQIAMILADRNGKTLAEFQSLIKPYMWDVGDATHNYYGLSYEDCEKYGVTQIAFMRIFRELSSSCSEIVAHNAKFDKGMMDVETAYREVEPISTPWNCTMITNKHITDNGKWPKLDFTLKHYTGKDLVGAHDAMADTRACRDIYFAMRGIKTW